jgi:hypothetical protein
MLERGGGVAGVGALGLCVGPLLFTLHALESLCHPRASSFALVGAPFARERHQRHMHDFDNTGSADPSALSSLPAFLTFSSHGGPRTMGNAPLHNLR